MNVLIIAEDYRKDQYLLKPLVEAMMKALGRRATVRMCVDPLLTGVEHVLQDAMLAEVVQTNPQVHLYVLVVDRDANPHRQVRVDQRTARMPLKPAQRAVGGVAVEEVEVWAMAGLDDPSGRAWSDVRRERDPKEAYFRPQAEALGVHLGPGEGRKALGEAAAKRYVRVKQRSPEVAELEAAVRAALGI